MHPARRVAARAVIAIVILAMTAACTTTQGSDKTGGDTVVLTLATFEPGPNANGQNHGPEAFVQNLGKVSQGRLKVELKTEYGDGAADAESQIVRAIASGEIDGGWPSTRAFARAGVPGLEVVEAPSPSPATPPRRPWSRGQWPASSSPGWTAAAWPGSA
jgi:TRAP-type C4-dicarboxylate transport system substrate-binding protein